MIRCKCCVMPNTRPDTPFVDGICSACLSYQKRPEIDWEARKAELIALLDRHDGRCIVPSSGGKDSTYQVMTLLEMGADVTVVTARTCHLTEIGRRNIDNLARHARTIEVVPNMTVRAKLNRLGLEMVGDISWPEHAAIFSTPFNVAHQTGHTLMFYGENPQDQYGGPVGSEEARQLTMRWRSEFGGFLGLRPGDFVGIEGITERDMEDYMVKTSQDSKLEAHFLGQYIPWDSRRNAEVAEQAGMRFVSPSVANWWKWENLDNAQTGIHDYFMFLKYGFGRGCQQISVDVRAGHLPREYALQWVEAHDGIRPHVYAGISLDEILYRIQMAPARFNELVEQFTDKAVHS
jgi:N-acetyl sugar amidotransferase